MRKESNWKDCLENNSSVSVSPDKSKAKSLVGIAAGRITFLDKNKLVDNTVNYLFEGYYSSVLELVHALALINGYNVGNHICLGYYLRDTLNRRDLYRLFDDCRFKRNSLIYYGKRMDFETAKLAIEKCKNLIKELNELVKKT